MDECLHISRKKTKKTKKQKQKIHKNTVHQNGTQRANESTKVTKPKILSEGMQSILLISYVSVDISMGKEMCKPIMKRLLCPFTFGMVFVPTLKQRRKIKERKIILHSIFFNKKKRKRKKRNHKCICISRAKIAPIRCVSVHYVSLI